jgi:hypothetical protein
MQQVRVSLRTAISVVLNGKWSSASTGFSLPALKVVQTADELIIHSTDSEVWHFSRSDVVCHVVVDVGQIPNGLENGENLAD